MTLLPGVLALALATVHVFAGRVRSFQVIPRSYWLSMAGGASVAYVFVHILPELSEGKTVLEGVVFLARFLERHVYLVALIGFALFYGLERFARAFGRDEGRGGMGIWVFWIHIGSFTAYNALIGYLLVHREETGLASLAFFAAAMGLHFVVNDYGLREHHENIYDRFGRWLLAAAVVVGWMVGSTTHINEPAVNTLFAFLAGSIVLNVIKEELPEERESRFWAFALGAAGYTALLLLTL
ncbi:hypothetical protein [Haladaptatus halobius]|uniref:hypothetical protein n=1 Tax=Haladaptatus halobius TaxID=2884875 RepID=UPI001D0AFDD3|nr:hypothetical protein [Haladaptatus halobius]